MRSKLNYENNHIHRNRGLRVRVRDHFGRGDKEWKWTHEDSYM